jgi:hypothetical protein
MAKRITFWLLWLGFLIYAFNFAPPEQPGTFDLILDLSTGKWDGINPVIIALFNLMGIFPLIYACMLLIDGRGQKIWAWVFSVISFAVGAFAILPYLGLRQDNPEFVGEKDWLLKVLDSNWFAVSLTLGATALTGYAIFYGNWGDFVQQWQTNRFIHVMSLDFCLLCALFPALLGDDMQRRNIKNQSIFWIIGSIPLFGALFYLALRPQLPDSLETKTGSPTVGVES